MVRHATDPMSGLFLNYSSNEIPYLKSLLANTFLSSGDFGMLAL